MSTRLKSLRQARADKAKAMRAIIDGAAQLDRQLTDDEQTKYDALNADQRRLAGDIAREEELGTLEADLDKPVSTPAGFAPVGSVGDDRSTRPYSTLGAQLQAIIKAGKGMGVEPQLLKINAAVSGASEGVAADGGFAVQPDFIPGILTPIYETGEIARLVRRIPVGPTANGVKFNVVDETSRANGSRWGGIQFKMAGEGDQGTATKAKLRPFELNLKKAIGLYFMTDELIEDSVAMQSLLEQGFRTELEFFVEDKFIRGQGSGEPLGILSSGAVVQQAIEAAQTIANSPASIVLNVTKMKSHMPASLYRNAVWLANQELEPTLVAATLGGTSAAMPVYLQQGSLANSPYAQLLGRPLVYVDYCEAVGTPGDLILANLGEYAAIDKNGVQGASSIHLRFDYDETAFRITYRFDGAPLWRTSVTPYKGAAARSPFITLATRS